MEVDTDGDILQFERGVVALRRERQVAVLRASPQNASLGEFYRLRTRDYFTLGYIRLIEGEGYLIGRDDTNGDIRLLASSELRIECRLFLGFARLETLDDLLHFVLAE